jgi:Xaa-Pro aminopeptidase
MPSPLAGGTPAIRNRAMKIRAMMPVRFKRFYRELKDTPFRLLDVGMEAHDAALAVIKPGLPAAEVDAAAVRVLEKNNMVQFRTHRTGRSVGASRQEKPELRDSDRTPLKPGMTFTVEPGIYVPGLGAARFGDTVAVTETGYEMLTPAPYYWMGR